MKAIVILALLGLTACMDGNRIFRDGVDGKNGHSVVSEVADNAPTCDTGGKTVLFGTDQNDNGVLDSADTSVKMFTVCNGLKGETGATGATGLQGEAGQNATPVNLVKLCPNVAGSYAGDYPEYAFRFGNALFGVYSGNGKASIAQFYPGTYTTTAPGVNCTFTIGADGVTLTY